VTNDDENPLAEAIIRIARAIDRLGNADAATPMGGLEALGEHLGGKLSEIALSIGELADAIRDHTSAGEQP